MVIIVSKIFNIYFLLDTLLTSIAKKWVSNHIYIPFFAQNKQYAQTFSVEIRLKQLRRTKRQKVYRAIKSKRQTLLCQ